MSAVALDSQPLAILIADDHDLFAGGLAETLAGFPDLRVVGRAADGAEAVLLASHFNPEIVLMDVSMPRLDGIAATAEITKAYEQTRVVILSAVTDAQTASRARVAGAAAYLFKGCPVDDLVRAIREVGESLRCAGPPPKERPLAAGRSFTALHRNRERPSFSWPFSPLTDRLDPC